MSAIDFHTARRAIPRTGDVVSSHVTMIKRFAKLALGFAVMALVVVVVVGGKAAIFLPRIVY